MFRSVRLAVNKLMARKLAGQSGVSPPKVGGARRRILRLAVEVLVVLAIILGIRMWQQQDVASGLAPPLAGVLLDGKGNFSLASKSGQPVLVHFWATWCPVCSAEQGSIEALAKEYPTITVAMQSGSAETVAAHLNKEGLSFPVLNDPDGTIAAQWGARAVPASFVVDGAGRIRFVEVGYTTGIGLRLRLWLAGWLMPA